MKTFAIIPTKLYPSNLDKSMYFLRTDPSIDGIMVMDNGVEAPKVKNSREWWINCRNMTIYEMWNFAWKQLKKVYPYEQLNLAFLNDDIDIEAYTIMNLVVALRESPESDNLAIVFPDSNMRRRSTSYSIEYTETTGGAGGMTGYCFMLKGELDIPYIDENLKLYWGDDDLVKQTLARGYKIGRVVGLPISHAGSFTINQMDREQRRSLMEADRAYFNKKYGENRSPVV